MRFSLEKSRWHHCLLWHGWQLGLSDSRVGSGWVESMSQVASHRLELALGPSEWRVDPKWDGGRHSRCNTQRPCIWSDGAWSGEGFPRFMLLVLVSISLFRSLVLGLSWGRVQEVPVLVLRSRFNVLFKLCTLCMLWLTTSTLSERWGARFRKF